MTLLALIHMSDFELDTDTNDKAEPVLTCERHSKGVSALRADHHEVRQ